MAKVKGLFVGMDGVIRAENIPITKRGIEFLDGAHPITSKAIFHDIDRINPPVYVCWHDCPEPEGHQGLTSENHPVLMEAVHMTQHRMKPLISKRYYRLFVRSVLTFIKVFAIMLVASFWILVGVALF